MKDHTFNAEGTMTQSKSSHPFLRSPIPLFLQVASVIRRRIEVGVWPPGERIPSLDELSSEFSVARTTVRQAVAKLEDEGLIWRKQGKGTFVNKKTVDRHWLNLEIRWDAIINLIEGTTITLLDAKDDVSLPALPPEEGRPARAYHYMKRLHQKDHQAYCIIDVYLDADIYRQNPGAFEKRTILSVLDSMHHLEIERAHQVLTIGTVDMENAKALGISLESPVANVRRIIRGKKRKILYLADIAYRADFVKLDIDLK